MQEALQKERAVWIEFVPHHRNVNTETKGECQRLECLYNCLTSPLEC